MQLRICGKATSAVWICISWEKKSGTAIRQLTFTDEQLSTLQIPDRSWPASPGIGWSVAAEQQLQHPQQEQGKEWASQSSIRNKTAQ